MAARAWATGHRARWPAAPAAVRGRSTAPEAAVLGLTAVLRLANLAAVPTDPYYDAAVRAMGTSWRAFVEGAFEPAGRVAIDKPAPSLWPQVVATRLLGFDHRALLLPGALAGIALVAAAMWLARSLAGRRAGLAAGLALPVLPSVVVTARSDTMDALMAALVTAAAALVVRAARTGRRRPLVAAGVLLGLAFDVKLAEALPGVAAAGVLWVLAAARGRGAGLVTGGTATAATAVAWLVAVTLAPLHPRPWYLGSRDGSPWQAAVVYNGVDRLSGTSAPVRRGARHAREHAIAVARRPGPPGPLRLLATGTRRRGARRPAGPRRGSGRGRPSARSAGS
jgi:4-amino-4-deoxy-L-arabinose transferase-like glycosyltransferase